MKNKERVKKRRKIKGCYGSHEWSKTSIICNKCKWHKDCGKERKTRREKTVDNPVYLRCV